MYIALKAEEGLKSFRRNNSEEFIIKCLKFFVSIVASFSNFQFPKETIDVGGLALIGRIKLSGNMK